MNTTPPPVPGTDSVRLEVPAGTESLRLVRLVVSGLASQHDADLSDLEDLRLAVSEIGAVVVERAGRGDRLRVEAEVVGRCVRMFATLVPPALSPAADPVPDPGDHDRPADLDDIVGALLATITDRYGVDLRSAGMVGWFERTLQGVADP